MGLRLRRFVVLLTALSFVAGGFGRDAIALGPVAPCHTLYQGTESAQPDDTAHADHAGHHQDHALAPQHEHDEGVPAGAADIACFKCCGICTAAPSLSAAAPADAAFVGFSVSYSAPILTFTDRPLAIDPGIPKRMA
jgi:hypothetical protein